ncbi:hypothetical protein POP72_002 [Pectobacterium phage POP72]|uniref:Uncharacterized protein n=2 Tax=Axomammavirus PP1 TaxID=2733578 RepID=I7FNR8_9CAUD|nr:hypothetical protein F486_gp02 [Pectobacterium phage PP1]AFP33665.1 hypothetical protein PP1_002 [Pectobacterium phage PP1]ARB10918.1 hypothetical protein POP72_002 [Pectobacterium phage POP72]
MTMLPIDLNKFNYTEQEMNELKQHINALTHVVQMLNTLNTDDNNDTLIVYLGMSVGDFNQRLYDLQTMMLGRVRGYSNM